MSYLSLCSQVVNYVHTYVVVMYIVMYVGTVGSR